MWIQLVLIVFFSVAVLNAGMSSTYAFMQLTDQANSTLNGLDKNLTSASISLAINQINASISPENEDGSSDLAMARSTLHDLIEGLSIKSKNQSLSSVDPISHDLCREQASSLIDCVIGDVSFALDSLNDGRPDMAIQILEKILKNVT
jgi:hypothetical protein